MVNDLATTCHGIETMADKVIAAGAKVVGIGLYGTRGDSAVPKLRLLAEKLCCSVQVLVHLKLQAWPGKQCYLCAGGPPLPYDSCLQSYMLNH